MKESSRKQIEYEGIKSGENNKNPIVNIITDEIFIKHENKTNEKKNYSENFDENNKNFHQILKDNFNIINNNSSVNLLILSSPNFQNDFNKGNSNFIKNTPYEANKSGLKIIENSPNKNFSQSENDQTFNSICKYNTNTPPLNKKQDNKANNTSKNNISNHINEESSIFSEDIDAKDSQSQVETDRCSFLKLKQVYDSLSEDEENHIKKENKFFIHPNGNFKFLFDMILFLVSLYCIIISPLEIIFYQDLGKNNLIKEIIIDSVFILDTIISLLVAYYDFEENLIISLEKILKHNLGVYFLLDLISSIPFNFMIEYEKNFDFNTAYIANNLKYEPKTYTNYYKNNDSGLSFIHFLNFPNIYGLLIYNNFNKGFFLLKIIRLAKTFKIINKNECLNRLKNITEKTANVFNSGFKMIIYFLYFLLISHILSCMFIFLGTIGYPNWIMSANLENQTFVSIYVSSLYFNHLTIFTVGYGDILSKNKNERIYNIILMIVGVMLYSFALTSISNIVKMNDEKRKIYESKKEFLNNISEKYFINKKLYDKLSRHLFHEMKNGTITFLFFLNELPITLQNEMILNMNRNIINSFKFFKNCYDSDFIIQVIISLRPTSAVKNDILVKQGDIIEEILFIKAGVLQLEATLAKSNNKEDNKNLSFKYSICKENDCIVKQNKKNLNASNNNMNSSNNIIMNKLNENNEAENHNIENNKEERNGANSIFPNNNDLLGMNGNSKYSTKRNTYIIGNNENDENFQSLKSKKFILGSNYLEDNSSINLIENFNVNNKNNKNNTASINNSLSCLNNDKSANKSNKTIINCSNRSSDNKSADYKFNSSNKNNKNTFCKNSKILSKTKAQFIFTNTFLLNKNTSRTYEIEILKVLKLRKNEDYGLSLIIDNTRSPLSVRTYSKSAELYLMNKIDVIKLYDTHPQIIEKIFDISKHNLDNQVSIVKKFNEKNPDFTYKYKEHESVDYSSRNLTNTLINLSQSIDIKAKKKSLFNINNNKGTEENKIMNNIDKLKITSELSHTTSENSSQSSLQTIGATQKDKNNVSLRKNTLNNSDGKKKLTTAQNSKLGRKKLISDLNIIKKKQKSNKDVLHPRKSFDNLLKLSPRSQIIYDMQSNKHNIQYINSLKNKYNEKLKAKTNSLASNEEEGFEKSKNIYRSDNNSNNNFQKLNSNTKSNKRNSKKNSNKNFSFPNNVSFTFKKITNKQSEKNVTNYNNIFYTHNNCSTTNDWIEQAEFKKNYSDNENNSNKNNSNNFVDDLQVNIISKANIISDTGVNFDRETSNNKERGVVIDKLSAREPFKSIEAKSKFVKDVMKDFDIELDENIPNEIPEEEENIIIKNNFVENILPINYLFGNNKNFNIINKNKIANANNFYKVINLTKSFENKVPINNDNSNINTNNKNTSNNSAEKENLAKNIGPLINDFININSLNISANNNINIIFKINNKNEMNSLDKNVLMCRKKEPLKINENINNKDNQSDGYYYASDISSDDNINLNNFETCNDKAIMNKTHDFIMDNYTTSKDLYNNKNQLENHINNNISNRNNDTIKSGRYLRRNKNSCSTLHPIEKKIITFNNFDVSSLDSLNNFNNINSNNTYNKNKNSLEKSRIKVKKFFFNQGENFNTFDSNTNTINNIKQANIPINKASAEKITNDMLLQKEELEEINLCYNCKSKLTEKIETTKKKIFDIYENNEFSIINEYSLTIIGSTTDESDNSTLVAGKTNLLKKNSTYFLKRDLLLKMKSFIKEKEGPLYTEDGSSQTIINKISVTDSPNKLLDNQNSSTYHNEKSNRINNFTKSNNNVLNAIGSFGLNKSQKPSIKNNKIARDILSLKDKSGVSLNLDDYNKKIIYKTNFNKSKLFKSPEKIFDLNAEYRDGVKYESPVNNSEKFQEKRISDLYDSPNKISQNYKKIKTNNPHKSIKKLMKSSSMSINNSVFEPNKIISRSNNSNKNNNDQFLTNKGLSMKNQLLKFTKLIKSNKSEEKLVNNTSNNNQNKANNRFSAISKEKNIKSLKFWSYKNKNYNFFKDKIIDKKKSQTIKVPEKSFNIYQTINNKSKARKDLTNSNPFNITGIDFLNKKLNNIIQILNI